MKNLIIILFLIIAYIIILPAQIPQIALVKPDGTTTIHTTFQSAYDAAADDDYIYLPGGTFSLTDIHKKLFIFGAGSDIDSCFATNKTIIYGISIYPAGSGGSIEGLEIQNSVVFQDTGAGYTISACSLISGIDFNNSEWTNVIIKNNFINGHSGYMGYGFSSILGNFSNSIITNNIITGTISGNYLTVNNNIFLYIPPQFYTLSLASNSNYNNNIFNLGSKSVGASIFYNNVNIEVTGNENYNVIFEAFPDIFINPGQDPYYYNENNDYHVKVTSQCHNSGTDGTDRGIYGGTFPWVEGMVPSNPHIYFKQVSQQTDSNGLLNIHFKVRTNE